MARNNSGGVSKVFGLPHINSVVLRDTDTPVKVEMYVNVTTAPVMDSFVENIENINEEYLITPEPPRLVLNRVFSGPVGTRLKRFRGAIVDMKIAPVYEPATTAE